MKIGFFGSPDFAAKILEEINKEFSISFVVSQTSKPVGRKQEITETAVVSQAKKLKIPYFTPSTLSDFKLPPADIVLVTAYGKILPLQLLNQPKFGFFNLHYSLLPKFRGASPVQFSILNGEKNMGVTLFKIDEKLDHGPIVSQESYILNGTETSKETINFLSQNSINLITNFLEYVSKNNKLPTLQPQDESKATYSKILTKEDGFIEFNSLKKLLTGNKSEFNDLPKLLQEEIKKKNIVKQWNNGTMIDFVRALNPWPCAWTILPNNKRLKILKTALNNGRIVIQTIQLEGKAVSNDSKFIESFIK